MTRRLIAVLLLISAVGCGPTRTSATKDLKKADLVVMTINKDIAIPGFHINVVKFDGEPFKVNGERDFYLTPGNHEVALGIGPNLSGAGSWFAPMDKMTFYIPASTGNLTAGKHYMLKNWGEGLSDIDNIENLIDNIATEVPK